MIFSGALWNWMSPVWLVAIAILFLYVLAFRRAGVPRLGILTIGLILFVLAFVSPIGELADGYPLTWYSIC